MEDFLQLKNKDFIFSCLDLLKSKDKLTESVLLNLTSASYCHRRFTCMYPILVEVSFVGTIDRRVFLGGTDNRRYYPEKYYIKNRAFIVCNDWYYSKRRDNRTPFIHWLGEVIQ
jgi:hypothetical protein